MEAIVDHVVVGLGLIGSAATRHLANAGADVVGIGPAEPDDWESHNGPFASHYDSGRVTRRLDARREWSILASRSIEQYGEIEQASNVDFHHATGLIFVRNDARGIANQEKVIAELELEIAVGAVDHEGHAARQPDYLFPAGWTTLAESAPAGFIDPRKMLQAQLLAAESAGARLRREGVEDVRPLQTGGWEVVTPTGTIAARSVVLATGPYIQDLHGRELQACIRPESVIMGRISEAEAERLRSMSSVIYLLDHPEIDDIYVVPPVRYPDGRYYIKMGGSNAYAPPLSSVEEKAAWMGGFGAEAHREVMTDVLTKVLPGVDFDSFEMKPCLITDTPSGLPYVDELDTGLFIAAGGNGHAGKSADAIGALAARLLLSEGEWPDLELAEADFAAKFGAWIPPTGSRHGN
ncbi:MAG: sarcosine oxidase [Verrucomicrobiales bacterium]|jgi:sarcosine oxidase